MEAISLWMESLDLSDAAGFSPPGPLTRAIPGAWLDDGGDKEHEDDDEE